MLWYEKWGWDEILWKGKWHWCWHGMLLLRCLNVDSSINHITEACCRSLTSVWGRTRLRFLWCSLQWAFLSKFPWGSLSSRMFWIKYTYTRSISYIIIYVEDLHSMLWNAVTSCTRFRGHKLFTLKFYPLHYHAWMAFIICSKVCHLCKTNRHLFIS